MIQKDIFQRLSDGRVLFFLVVAVAAMLSADGRAEQGDAGGGDADQAAYDRFGMQFVAALNDRNLDELVALFDISELAASIAEDVFDDAEAQRQYRRGFMSNGERAVMQNILSAWFRQEGRARFLGTLQGEQPLLRVDYSDGGHEYVLLSMRRQQGQLVCVDFFTLTTGRYISESMGIASQLLLRPTDSMLAKLFGNRVAMNDELLARFRRIGELHRAADYQGVYELIQSLPDAVRDNRLIVDMAVQMAVMIGDAEYEKELARLARLHGDDESASFMLVDYYYLSGNLDKAYAGIDRVAALFGNDAALENIRANLAYAAQDLNKAEYHAQRAINLEPDFEDGYWTLVSILRDQSRFEEIVVQLQRLEADFGYQFGPEDFDNEYYADFYRSEVFREWLR